MKILDFGLARASAAESGLTQQGAIIGTPAYMAPEQAAGAKVDHRCDLFSLGCVLYRLCTGRMPFHGKDTVSTLVAVAMENPPAPAAIDPAVPPDLSDLVMRLLAKKPADRPPSAQVVAETLQQIEHQADATTALLGQKARQGKRTGAIPLEATRTQAIRSAKSRPRLAWLVAGVVLALGVLAASIVLFRKTPHGTTAGGQVIGTVGRPAVPELPRFINRLGMKFALVPKGKAWLGGITPDQREVEIVHDFYLGVYEVTQQEWESVMGKGINPSHFARGGAGKEAVKDIADADLQRFPVESVSWHDCQEFMVRLNEKVRENGWVYRLPTEEEWEYACRGGPLPNKADYEFSFYVDRPTNSLQPDRANFKQTALGRTCKVGSYPPNRLGLYDMHGNVAEWCLDIAITPEGASQRVNRGGSWPCLPRQCRAVHRFTMAPGFRDYALGLRLARVPVGSAATPARVGSFVPLVRGNDLTGWVKADGRPAEWKIADGVLEVVPGQGDIMTVRSFGPDFELHVEFNIPLHADRKGQRRGNSGVFLLGRYEIQILDSYKNPQPPERACAALFGQIGPSRNVCKPPNEWQTFDITFRAPRLDGNKKVVQRGELTVVHNGVTVIDKGKVNSPTAVSQFRDVASTGPILLQEHGSPIRFRNLKLRELPPLEQGGALPRTFTNSLTMEFALSIRP